MISWSIARPLRRSAIAGGAVLVIWLLIHPWPKAVLAGAGNSSYAAFQGIGAVRSAVGTALASINLVPALTYEWRADVLISGLVAGLLLLSVARFIRAAKNPVSVVPGARTLWTGLIWFAGPVILTSALLKLQFPYYGLIPMTGIILVGSVLLSKAPQIAITSTLVMFLAVGVVGRQALLGQDLLAEQNFHVTAPAMQRIERGIRNVVPTLPPAARVFVYVQAPGRHGVYTALYRGQPLRVWYHDPDIRVLDPLKDGPRAADENLVWISYDLGVYGIDTKTLGPRGEGTRARFDEYQKTLRAYAMGIAGSGDVDRAVEILTTMRQYSEALGAYDRRTAAALLLSFNRIREAESLLVGTSRFRRDDAIEEVAGLVAKPVPGLNLDTASMQAFELEPGDTAAVRAIQVILVQRGFPESAARFGARFGVGSSR